MKSKVEQVVDQLLSEEKSVPKGKESSQRWVTSGRCMVWMWRCWMLMM
jgi:hypothetical protein